MPNEVVFQDVPINPPSLPMYLPTGREDLFEVPSSVNEGGQTEFQHGAVLRIQE